jgi:hypothetical protein
MKNFILCLSVLLYNQIALARVELALFKIYRPDGSFIQYEKNGQFAHTALLVDAGWIHAHPYKGVEVLPSLRDFPFPTAKITRLRLNSPIIDGRYYQHFLGLPFDSDYSWDEDKIYCSELMAKILRIRPVPMVFDPKIWGPNHPQSGKPGVSPDGLYRWAIQMGFKQVFTP